MRSRTTPTVLSVLLLTCAGCGAAGSLGSILAPSRTTVLLINNGDFPVDVRLFFARDQEIPEDAIDDVGTERNFLINAGGTMSFDEPCDDLQAVKIDRAQLRVIGSIFAPDRSSDILRDGSDFGCGDRIVFTFDHSSAIVDFSIASRVERRGSTTP